MSNTGLEALKLEAEELSKKLEDPRTTLGKLVDDMFVSATRYLEDHARRTGDEAPWRMWLPFQESWRRNVTDSVGIAQTTNNAYNRYKALFEEVKDVVTGEELAQAVVLLKGLIESMSPVLPIDSADVYHFTALDVMTFRYASQFPELDRHIAFIFTTLEQFSGTWKDLHGKSLGLFHELDQAIYTTIPKVFSLRIQKATETVVPIFDGIERFVASVKFEV